MAADKSDAPDRLTGAPAALLLAEIERLKEDLIQAEWKKVTDAGGKAVY